MHEFTYPTQFYTKQTMTCLQPALLQAKEVAAAVAEKTKEVASAATSHVAVAVQKAAESGKAAAAAAGEGIQEVSRHMNGAAGTATAKAQSWLASWQVCCSSCHAALCDQPAGRCLLRLQCCISHVQFAAPLVLFVSTWLTCRNMCWLLLLQAVDGSWSCDVKQNSIYHVSSCNHVGCFCCAARCHLLT